MAIATSNAAALPVGKGHRVFTLPIAASTHIYMGRMMAQLTASGMVVPGSTALSGRCIGVSEFEQDNSSGAAGDLRVTVHNDAIFMASNGSGANAVSEATPLGAPLFMFDDHTVYDNSVGDTLKLAGFYAGMEPETGGKVRVYIPAFDFGSSTSDVGEDSAASMHGVRGASTADIPDLAAFTVAGVDGLTYVAGERILLKNQTAPAENGIYVVGTVGGGTAPLTRALDADGADEIVPGMLVHVSEGTVGLDSYFFLTTNAPITIGTTSLTFVEIPSYADLAGTGGAALVGILDTAARLVATTVETALAELAAPREVRGVAVTNVADLGAFVVAGFDGVTYAEGDLVLLANQTTGAQCGVYVVGVVAGTAPLTRAPGFETGKILRSGYTVHASEGTLFANTSWFISTTGAITLGTTAHLWFPESVVFSLAIPPGTGTITFTTIPILSATKTMFNFTNVAEVTADLTVRYALNGAATAGVVGTASASMIAEVAAGTVNVDDDSTMLVQVINR